MHLLFSLAVIAAFGSSPVCKKMTTKIWQKNQSSCYQVFASAPLPHKIEDGTAKRLCDCVADELVYKMTCRQIARYESDKDYAAKVEMKVTTACKAKVPMAVFR